MKIINYLVATMQKRRIKKINIECGLFQAK